MADYIREVAVHFTTSPSESFQVGTLAERDHRIFFEYLTGWIDRGLELSPFILPLRSGLIEQHDREFGPLFGLFDDSLPDGWGLLLMDRHFRKLGLDSASISSLDRLAYLGDRTMGALTYYPPTDREDIGAVIFDLHELAGQSREIYAGHPVDVLPQLFLAGGSPGGARPKVLVGYNPATNEIISGEDDLPDGFEHWIVKFSAQEDAIDAGPTEYAYSVMARAAGIDMPETRLFEIARNDCFFGAKRFDRKDGNRRLHIHTFGNLIHANFRIPSCDYSDLFKVSNILTKNYADKLRVFRLMVFNVHAHNRDDHAKNFAFILDEITGQWSLSPAYDLTFTIGPGGEHTTTIAGEGRMPTRRHMLQLADQFDISTVQANNIIDEVTASVARWKEFASYAGVTTRTSQRIAKQIIS